MSGLTAGAKHWLAGALALWLVACSAPAPAPAVPAVAEAHPVEEVALTELARALAAGETTSLALTEAYLARIAALDAAGPRLSAVIELNPQAREEARARDAERATGGARGVLHGIPILIKDNIDAMPMATSAGSLALAGHHPPRDAFLVQRLRAAGAVILGKTNLSEWANFRSSRSTSGWSSRGGQTRNPYVLDRNPCGSSSGSGSATAASLAAAAVGTETDGSIICPAAVNGLVGIKPTVGRISRDGIVPISHAQDTAGPMARSVADSAALLQAMLGDDPSDPASVAAAGHPWRDPDLGGQALAAARIGVLRDAMGFHPDVDAAMERTIAALRAGGAEIIDPVDIPERRAAGAAEYAALLVEFKHGLEAYLAASAAVPGTLAELIDWNREHADRTMPWFGQEIFLQAQASADIDDPAYREARAMASRLAGEAGLDAALASARLDAVLTPAVGPAWPIDWVNGDHFLGAGYSSAAIAGNPSITVPAGDSHGLPIGVVLMGRRYDEPRLIELGHALERALQARRAPRYLPTLTP